jgi:hypothetical protein
MIIHIGGEEAIIPRAIYGTINQERTIFKLESYLMQVKKKKGSYKPSSSFECSKEFVGYYTSIREAEAGMRECIDFYNKGFRIDDSKKCYSFLVSEYDLNIMIDEDEALTRRSYLSDGKLEESCLTSEITENGHPQIPFMGRKPEDIRFKEGDIVEVICCDAKISFGIVSNLPLTEEYIKERIQRDGKRWNMYYCDYSDDSYTVLFSNLKGEDCGHSHLESIYVFPQRLPIPKKLEEGLHALYQFDGNDDNSNKEE